MMKNPFIKVPGLGLHKRHRHANQPSLAQLDELSQASQDMQDIRDCYDRLLSAAAGTTNNAYEFSESLKEMGDCLLEKTALSDDEDSGRVLLMLGKVQFDIQKLIDNYRSHISQTITVPSESLLNELRIVEDMKKQCDEKRMTYEAMKMQYDKGRLRSSKGEYVSSRQLQSAWAEFDENATLFILRMKSLKRGQSRSLLTQAARHHAAQMCFFRNALKSLEAIEPDVKSTTEQQHIEYHFSGLEDDDDRDSVYLTDDEDDEDESDDYCDGLEDSGLNSDNHGKVQKNEVSSSGNSMELDNEDPMVPQVVSVNSAKENMYRKPFWNTGSKSAPLSAESTFDPSERFRQMRQSSTRKLNTYVLPTPLEKRSVTSGIGTQHSQPRPATNTWHSMPLEQKKYEKTFKKENISGPLVSSEQSVQTGSSNDNKPTPLAAAPQIEAHSSLQADSRSAFSAKKIKRYAFSGPLTGDSRSNKPLLSASGPIGSTVHHQPFPGSRLRTTLTQPLSTSEVPSLSASASASRLSLPMIRELHELPRPPANVASKKTSKVGFSAPLVTFKGEPDLIDTNKLPASDAAYTLPVPSGSQRDTTLASKQTGNWNSREDEVKASPHLSPISFKNF